mmetsp:Transcript_2377/g.3455  ORF Transcript_2377/g.3455 Transcript_2377/m.3455 type:complete len:260 (-) Transcript_2377:1115-1894(-)
MALVLREDRNGLAYLKLNSKPVNALSYELMAALIEELEKVKKDKQIKALILTSAFPNIFSAGLNLYDMYNTTKEKFIRFWGAFIDVTHLLYTFPIPTICACPGHANPAGCGLALCCDYRILRKGYKIGLSETKIGIVAPWWLQDLMIQVIGRRQANRALQCGILFPAEEALKIGLIDAMCDTLEDMETEIKKGLTPFLKVVPMARAHTKHILQDPFASKLLACREQDCIEKWNVISSPPLQNMLGLAIKSISKRSKSKL